MGLMVPSRVMRMEAGRAPTWGLKLKPSASSFSASVHSGPKPAVVSGVTVQPVARVMRSIQASSSGSSSWSETNSMVP